MKAIAIAAALALTACASRPIQPPKVVNVVVEKIVPVPEKLTEPCQAHEPKAANVAEAVRLANVRKAALEECSSRMSKIRGLAK